MEGLMFKFFSRFSKRKLVPTIAVILIIAIGTPLVTRQFWVYDADSKKFEAASSTTGSDTLTEVSKDQLVKSKQYAKIMIEYLKPKLTSDNGLVASQALAEMVKYAAIDQEITDSGDLVITPNITYQNGLKYLEQIKNQVLAISTDNSTDPIVAELDQSIKLLGKQDFKGENQGAAVKTEFTRVSDAITTKISAVKNDALKDILPDTATKLKAFPADDSVYLAAMQADSNLNQAQIESISIQQKISNLISNLTPLITAPKTDSTVSINTINNSIVNQAKAADLLQSPYVAKKLKFTDAELNDWYVQSQAILKDNAKYPDITSKSNAIGGLAYDKLHPYVGITVTDLNDKDWFVKNYGIDSAALATASTVDMAKKRLTYDIANSNYWQGYNYNPDLSGKDTQKIFANSMNTTWDSKNWDTLTALAAKQGWDITKIRKYGESDVNAYIEANQKKIVDAALAAGTSDETTTTGATQTITATGIGTQTTPTAALGSSNTDPTSIFMADGSYNETAQALQLAAAVEAQSTEAAGVKDEYNELLKNEDPRLLAKNTNAIHNLLHNNLTDSYFGQIYLAYLQVTGGVQVWDVYKERNDFCNNNKTALANDSLLTDIAKWCDQNSTEMDNVLKKAADANQRFATMSEIKGSLSMDPRTGHMLYTTPVVYFDKGGKPNIAGTIQFDPVNNQVSGNLTKAFGDSRVTIYSDAFTGEVYLEYSNITKPLVQIGSKGSILTLQTIQVSKDGKIGGTFTAFHHLMNYNPNTGQLEVKLTRDSSPYNMWINTKGELRGTYQFKVGNNISTGIMVDSKGNFTVPVNYTVNGTTLGSVWIGTNGQISGQIDLGKTIGNHSSLFVGFDKSGISSVGVPIGGIAGSPFSLSVGRDGGLSFGGFIPIAGIPVPIALGQDAHGNITLSWPGGHWSLGSESRPINAPAPKIKEDKSGYDGGQIWYHHSFKKGWKVVRVYNGPVKIDAKEQQSRAETIFKKYNEYLKRNPSISEFLNWYFYSGHELFDGGLVQLMNSGGEQKRNERLAYLMTRKLTVNGFSKVVPANAKFPNVEEYKWIQAGKKAEEFPKRPTDLLSVNPFDSDVIAKAQTAANNPTSANIAQLSVAGSTTSMSQVTTAMTTSINQDSDYAKTMAKFKEYFNPTAATTSSDGSGFIAAPATNSNTN